jgi:DNA helicase-2/ATP-dependent DNA helicase PcrA
MDILSKLNEAQQQAVKQVDGPLLVLAGPGSGKTRVLTHRVAYLVGERHIPAHQILAVTFTNKAAREMKERLIALIGEARVHDVTIGTFHSTCARFLRRDGERIGLERAFAIYDEDDQMALMKQIIKEMNLNDKQYRPGAMLGAISKAKNELVSADEYVPESYWHEAVARAYTRYQQLLGENNAVDFDDLLMSTVRLFRENPDILGRYQERYRYLHVDEFQDTNIAQYELVKLLADKYQNLFCVGDEDQCVPAGTQIQMADGTQSIEKIKTSDPIIVGAGRGHTMPMDVERVHRRKFEGKLVNIQTKHGHTLRVTPNHILFARLGISEQIHYVYLMYRVDRGYRIGIAFGSRSDGTQSFNGLEIRCRQEHADKVWILRVCHSKSDALYWEQFYAFEYGIPTTLFHGIGRKLALAEEQIAHLFRNIDTDTRAAQLMSDLQLFPEFPHFRPKAVIRGPIVNRKVIHFKLFGDMRRTESSPWGAHRVSINTTDPTLKKQLTMVGYHTRPGRRQTWRVESSNLDYDKAEDFVRKLAQSGGEIEVARTAFFTDTQSSGGITLSFDFQPASHIRPTMLLPVLENGKIVDDEVTQVTWEDFKGAVYDLDIPKVHNYIANGIVVHNSIYGWRGADYRNVLRFRDDFPNSNVILLEQNYRSTQTILDVAQAVIRKNKSRHKKELWTENARGIPVTLRECYDQEEEAQFVVDEIQKLSRKDFKPRDFAVFYRTNAQSRTLEDAFVRRGLPYQLVGSVRFYQRREVKDVMAYLRLVNNPNDSVAFNRVLNVPPRGIGKTTQDMVTMWAERMQASPHAVLEALRKQIEEDGRKTKEEKQSSITNPNSLLAAFDARARKTLLAFLVLAEELRAAQSKKKLSELVEYILLKTGFETYINDGTEEGQDRWDNVDELIKATKKFDQVSPDQALVQFLEEVSLVADIDSIDDTANAPTLMTLHTAKGLEFPVVFMVGMEEGLFPHSRSLEDPNQMEEERRLCYVGITRAKERLYLLNAFRRTMYGNSEASDPSRFLADIPRDLVSAKPADTIRPKFSRRDLRDDDDDDFDLKSSYRNRLSETHKPPTTSFSKPKPAAPKPSRKTEFQPGDRVQHALFGNGTVVSSHISGDDEEVQVAFDGKGVKRLIARFAGLRKK